MKAAWELMEIFYADKLSQSWLPERLVDWLAVMIFLLFSLFVSEIHFIIFSLVAIVCDCHSNGGIFWQDYDCLLSSTQATIHSKLVDFQKELVTLQV